MNKFEVSDIFYVSEANCSKTLIVKRSFGIVLATMVDDRSLGGGGLPGTTLTAK